MRAGAFGPDAVCAEGGGYAYGSAGATAESDDQGSATASATAEATASATALPETGGPGASFAASMALPMLALLVVGRIFAQRVIRKG